MYIYVYILEETKKSLYFLNVKLCVIKKQQLTFSTIFYIKLFVITIDTVEFAQV